METLRKQKGHSKIHNRKEGRRERTGKGLGKGEGGREGGREGKEGEGRNRSLGRKRREVNRKGSGEREGREWSHTSTIRTND